MPPPPHTRGYHFPFPTSGRIRDEFSRIIAEPRCDGGQKTRDRRIAQMPTPGGDRKLMGMAEMDGKPIRGEPIL